MNLNAVASRHRSATEVGKSLANIEFSGWVNTLFASCSDIPELLDYIERLRDYVAGELETFANQCQTRAELVQDQMSTCANDHNLGIAEAYRQAANIARVGQSYKNVHCTNCRDTRGGPVGHRTEDCTWAPPVGLFDEKEQCFGRDLIQIGWMSPEGMTSIRMDFVPPPGWQPIFVRKVT